VRIRLVGRPGSPVRTPRRDRRHRAAAAGCTFRGVAVSPAAPPGGWSRYASPRALRRFVISCLGAGEQSGHVPPFTRRRLPSHGLVYISAGRGTYSEYRPTQTDVPVVAPAVIWLAPGVDHGYGPDAGGWSEHWILFAGQSFATFEEQGLGSRHRPVLPLPQPVETRELFAGLRESLETVGARSEIAASVTTQRFLLAVLNAVGDGHGTADRASLVDLLARDAIRPLSVPDRARELGVSVRELRDTLKAATGLTLNDFVIEVRISKAQALLAETRLDIGRIAASVGYDDPAYFSRLFSRRVGVSPTVFRRQQSRSGSG
jgi:AraC-like DNA-binding protein